MKASLAISLLAVAPVVLRAADAHPDLTGFWTDDGKTKAGGNIAKDYPGFKLPLTPAGEAALKYNFEHTIDPGSLCIPRGLPRADTAYGQGGAFQILQVPGSTAILYQFGTFRVIATDGRKHSEDPDPSFYGEEIGTWEGDTFVVDAVGFKDANSWIDENANPHSDAMHVVERWTRPDPRHLHLEMSIEDPKFYTKPLHYQRTWVLDAKKITREQACSENNLSVGHLEFGPGPIRPDGSRGYDETAPLPPPPTPDHPGTTILPPGVK